MVASVALHFAASWWCVLGEHCKSLGALLRKICTKLQLGTVRHDEQVSVSAVATRLRRGSISATTNPSEKPEKPIGLVEGANMVLVEPAKPKRSRRASVAAVANPNGSSLLQVNTRSRRGSISATTSPNDKLKAAIARSRRGSVSATTSPTGQPKTMSQAVSGSRRGSVSLKKLGD